MVMKFGCSKKNARVVKLSGLIAGKVEVREKVTKLNWYSRVVLSRLELVDAAPEPKVKTKRNRKQEL